MSAPAIRKQDLKWLHHIGRGLSTMYPGQRADHVPEPVIYRLTRLGLVEEFIPANPAHRERIALTHAGKALLSKTKEPAA